MVYVTNPSNSSQPMISNPDFEAPMKAGLFLFKKGFKSSSFHSFFEEIPKYNIDWNWWKLKEISAFG